MARARQPSDDAGLLNSFRVLFDKAKGFRRVTKIQDTASVSAPEVADKLNEVISKLQGLTQNRPSRG